MRAGRWLACLESLNTAKVVGIIVGIKILLMLAVILALPASAGTYYGVGFADNYDRLAWNLAQGLGYRFQPDTSLTLMREPGYPVFLAGLFSLFGRSLMAARVANIALAALTAGLLVRFARRIFASRSVGILAAVFFLFNPGVVVSELRGGVEIVFIFLVVALVYALTVAVQSDRKVDFLKAGLLVGLTSLVRSTALLFPAFLVVYYFCWRPARREWTPLLVRLVIVGVAAVAMLSPWIIRNDIVAGVPLPTASVSSVAAHAGQYICSHRTMANRFQDDDMEAARVRGRFAESLGLKFKPGGYYYQNFYDVHDELVFNKALGKLVVDTYRQEPYLLVKCPALNVFNFWFQGKNWTATAINAVVQLPYLILGILGMVLAMKSGRGRAAGLCMLFCAYLMLVHIPVHAQARYSIPLIPFLSLFAAYYLTTRLKASDVPAVAATPVTASR